MNIKAGIIFNHTCLELVLCYQFFYIAVPMKFSILLVLVPFLTYAEDKVLYYYGMANLTNLQNGKFSSERLLLTKSMLPSKNMIIEVACTKAEGKPAQISPVYMDVTGDRLLISDSEDMKSKKLTGTGEVVGTSWAWEYLYFSMKFETPGGSVGIKDWNFVVGDKLIARKQIFFRDNPIPIQLWDVDTTSITQTIFVLLSIIRVQ